MRELKGGRVGEVKMGKERGVGVRRGCGEGSERGRGEKRGGGKG